MSGFDNGTLQGGIFTQVKQFGSILRGFGPPVPQTGVVGDLYIDVQTWELFNKRSPDSGGDVDPWGHYLFIIPSTYQAQLKWFTPSVPTNDIGINGDYALLWAGYPNYGLQPSIFGPKAAGVWPSSPTAVAVTLNTLYTAEDEHSIGGSSSYVFQSVTGASGIVAAGTTLVGIQRAAPATTSITLPSVAAQAAIGSPLDVVDWSTGVINHVITLTPNGTDTIMQQPTWKLVSTAVQLAGIRLLPSPDLSGWVIAP